MFDIAVMFNLAIAMEANGFSLADVERLTAFPRLGDVKLLPVGRGAVVPTTHIIDCDTDPTPHGCDSNLKVIEHTKGGQLEWDPDTIELYQSKRQGHGWLTGYDLITELKETGRSSLNGCVLEFLRAHPELIPAEMRKKNVVFLGTIHQSNPRTPACVRLLNGGARQLASGFGSNEYVAVLKEHSAS